MGRAHHAPTRITSVRHGGAEHVERSPADALRLAVAAAALVLLLTVEALFGRTLVVFAAELLDGLSALPAWITTALVFGTRTLAVLALGGGLLWIVWGRRWRMLGTGVAAAGLAAGLAWLLTSGGPQADEPTVSVASFPGEATLLSGPGLAAATAVLVAGAPWWSRRARRLTWILLAGLVISTFLSSPASFDTAMAACAGWLAGAAVVLALGAPTRRPPEEAIRTGLLSVGVPLATLAAAQLDARGSTPYFGSTTEGDRLFIKVVGTDERSADLLFRLYRRLQPHDFGDERPFASLRHAVEHEAFASLAAGRAGVRTPELRAFTVAEPHGFVLAYEALAGRSLDRVPAAELDGSVQAEAWALLAALRRARIAHRDLRLANLFLDGDGHVWLIDFGFARLGASSMHLAGDVAELLASLCLRVGPEPAVRLAVATVGRAPLRSAEPRLRPWALSGATRSAYKHDPERLRRLRRCVTDVISRRELRPVRGAAPGPPGRVAGTEGHLESCPG
jgi:undecaprenyl-diphosphatase